MASVWIDVDLNEVSTRDLLDELENRYLGNREKDLLLELIKNDEGKKVQLFLKVKDRFSLIELEELFKENTYSPPCKEQLSIFPETVKH